MLARPKVSWVWESFAVPKPSEEYNSRESMKVNVSKLFVVTPSMGDKSSQIHMIIAT
jgi:hypothetical protein